MKQWLMYFRLECKRMLTMLSSLIVGTILFLIVVSGIVFLSSNVLSENKKEFEIINVGIVGSEEEKYTKLAISMVEKMDTVQLSAKFNYCTELEGQEGLESGQYDVLFIIPEDYVKAFMHGENKSIIARFGKGQSGITSYIMKQLSEFASELLIESEKNIYSMQDYYREVAPEKEKDALVQINLEYLNRILARGKAISKENISRTDGMSLVQYYFCVALLLIFLLLGLLCAKLLQKHHIDFHRKLMLEGIGPAKQVLGKLASLLMIFYFIYIVLAIIIIPILSMTNLDGTEIFVSDTSNLIILFAKISVILVPICSFIMLVYELCRESVNGIVLYFVVTMTLAYVSGYFYPLSFLPVKVQEISQFTITRAMFTFVSDCVNGNTVAGSLLAMGIHTLILVVLMVAMKNIGIKRSE